MVLSVTLELLRFGLLAAVFGYAAYQDHVKGEVSNKVWLYIPFGLALTLVQLFVFTPYLVVFAVPLMVVMGALSVGLFYVSGLFGRVLKQKGDVFGGADSKALLALSLCFPLTASYSFLPYVNYVVLAFGVGALIVLLRKGLRRDVAVRFLPYLFVGFILVGL